MFHHLTPSHRRRSSWIVSFHQTPVALIHVGGEEGRTLHFYQFLSHVYRKVRMPVSLISGDFPTVGALSFVSIAPRLHHRSRHGIRQLAISDIPSVSFPFLEPFPSLDLGAVPSQILLQAQDSDATRNFFRLGRTLTCLKHGPSHRTSSAVPDSAVSGRTWQRDPGEM